MKKPNKDKKIAQFTAEEWQWLHDNRCSHGHRYTSHINCFFKETNKVEKIGFLDIETSNLKANFGIVLCGCIKPAGSRKIFSATVTPKDLKNGSEDKPVIEALIGEMLKYDRIVGHYSKRFDVPFLRTRAIIHGLEFPKYGQIYHTDTYDLAKSLLALHSNRQNIIAESLNGSTIKTRINHAYWRQAVRGDKTALKYVLDHCKADVIELEKNYNNLIGYRPIRRTSI